MTIISIKDTIRHFVISNFLEGDLTKSFGDGDSFFDNQIIDSTGVLELALFIEQTFGFRVEDEELIPDNLDSIDNLEKYIKTKLNQ